MKALQIQSNGMGQQSAALYLMSCLGIFPRLDYSIMADTGAEKEGTYKYATNLVDWIKRNNGVKLIIDQSKNLYDDIMNNEGGRMASLPLFTSNGGKIIRQCTYEYKIEIINKVIRELQAKKKGQSFDPVNVWFGISFDEIHRMNPPSRKNVTHVYPFTGYQMTDKKVSKIDWGKQMTRSQINKWMIEKGFEIPPKSSCIFCPFMKNTEWLSMKIETPKDFQKAVRIDHKIRNKAKLDNQNFIHRSLKPLEEVRFNQDQLEIEYDCMGYCGI